jgi:fermentation-respiration switch protein FrsA (DUF1100 family)
LFMMHRLDLFDNCDEILKVHPSTSLLVLHGTEDQLVPHEHAERIFNASMSRSKLRADLKGATHNSPLLPQAKGGHLHLLLSKVEKFVKG